MASKADAPAGGAPRGACALCGQQSGLACARCRAVWYCGASHQRQHWPQHRSGCSIYAVRTTPELGRHLVAARDIRQGEVIVKERPLVVYPDYAEPRSCSNCCKRRPESECPSCGILLCAPHCRGLLHAAAECNLLEKAQAKKKVGDEALLSGLGILRCLLLEGERAKTLRLLQSAEGVSDTVRGILNRAELLFICMLGKGHFKSEDVRFATGVLQTNAFKYGEEAHDTLGSALFGMISLLAHSCKPNARYTNFGKSATDFSGAVIANVNIPTGAIISVCYVDRMDPTDLRREKILASKLFLCRCERCSDPTEFGLRLGIICCPRCRTRGRESVLVPTASAFGCRTCGAKLSPQQMLQARQSELESETVDFGSKDPLIIEGFIERHLFPRGLFHRTFSCILNAKLKLVEEAYGHFPGFTHPELTDALLERKLSLCRELLSVYSVLSPGHTGTRASLLEEAVQALLEVARRQVAKHDDAQEVLQKAEEYFAEMQQIYLEPSKQPEVQKIKADILQLKKSIQDTD